MDNHEKRTTAIVSVFYNTFVINTFSFISSGDKSSRTTQRGLFGNTIANEYTLNQDGEAKGIFNINVMPKGIVNQKDREAIDVAFVHDTSGSMDYYFEREQK